MHRVHLTYTLSGSATAAARPAPPAAGAARAPCTTPARSRRRARSSALSYRHVWGELKRWEGELGQTLVLWVKGQPARLSPFGEKLLWAERRAQARLAPQIEALRSELERAFAIAFDDTRRRDHDLRQPRRGAAAAARAGARERDKLHLDIQFTGSVDALAALERRAAACWRAFTR